MKPEDGVSAMNTGLRTVALRRVVLVALAGFASLSLLYPAAFYACAVAFGLTATACVLLSSTAKTVADNTGERPGTLEPEDVARLVVAAISDPVLLIDRAQQLLSSNTAGTEAFGLMQSGDVIALRFRSPDFLASVAAAIDAKVAATVSFSEGAGARRSWTVDVLPIAVRAQDAPPIFMLHFHDRTAEQRIERMRTDFVANASHELRTPLASLIGFIETLQGPARADDVARARFLEIMREQAARMSRLIDDLLSLSRVEMKRGLAVLGSVDLDDLLRRVCEPLAPLLAQSQLVPEFEFGPGPHVVNGDRDELLQVFSNLIENACKYGAGGNRLVLSLSTGSDTGNGVIRASVRDFGAGIAAEHVPRLTERFYRVDVGTSRAKRGTGLGLSIVRNILLRHSAQLTIESEVGKGSTFTAVFRK